MASELSDCQSNMATNFQSTGYTIGQEKHTKRKYNESKIAVLSAIDYLHSINDIANCPRISVLTGLRKTVVNSILYRLRIGYIEKELDKYNTNSCILKFKLRDKGRTKLGKMLDRFENNLTLNLKSLPEKKDYSNFVLLPGIKEYEQMRKEGKI